MALGIQPSPPLTAYLVIAKSHKPNKATGIIDSRWLGSTSQLNLSLVRQSTIAAPILLLHMQAQSPRSIVERLSTVRVKDALQLLEVIPSITPLLNDARGLEEKTDHAGPLMAVR